MKQVRLIEPNLLARVWMRGDRLTNLPRAQFIITLPLEFDLGAATVSLHLLTILCLKHVLPRKVERLAVISHVHHLLVCKPIPDSRVDQIENLATIGNRSLATVRRNFNTKESEDHGPLARIRHLVVQR